MLFSPRTSHSNLHELAARLHLCLAWVGAAVRVVGPPSHRRLDNGVALGSCRTTPADSDSFVFLCFEMPRMGDDETRVSYYEIEGHRIMVVGDLERLGSVVWTTENESRIWMAPWKRQDTLFL
jgi:hypothetical protein